MLQDCDVVLMGSGVAPLVAAAQLLVTHASQDISLLVLNPDRDFFLEDSELPLDPYWPLDPARLSLQRIQHHTLEDALKTLQPVYPGTVEFWSEKKNQKQNQGIDEGFHDPHAPHVRQRIRLLAASRSLDPQACELMERLYVEWADRDIHCQIHEHGSFSQGIFPGLSGPSSDYLGLSISDGTDVDVSLYRNGIMEYLRERLGPERMVSGVMQVEWSPEGIRYTTASGSRTVKIRSKMLVFWTPRLTSWILTQAQRMDVKPLLPLGVRVWEQWNLISKNTLDPRTIGMFREMSVWAEMEGSPRQKNLNRLAVLRAGPLLKLEDYLDGRYGSSWASEDSFQSLNRLCCDFLKWERYSIRLMKSRSIFEWNRPVQFALNDQIKIVVGADGPLVDVVRQARYAGEHSHVS